MTEVISLRGLWPPVRAKGIDLDAGTWDLLCALGLVRRAGPAGSFAWLSLGLAVRDRVEGLIRRSFLSQGFSVVDLPVLQSREIWERSGRWSVYGTDGSLFTVRDRDRVDALALGPTSEEASVTVVGEDLRSYRDLPVRLYQSTTKFRNEISPRHGLLRAREFEMTDAYTFDTDPAGMADSVRRLNAACSDALAGMGFHDVLQTDAYGGQIAKAPSTEHVVVNPLGQSDIVRCPHCRHCADVEVGRGQVDPVDDATVKVLVFRPAGAVVPADATSLVAVLIRADLAVSTVKLARVVGADDVVPLDPARRAAVFGVRRHELSPADVARAGARVVVDVSAAVLDTFTVADPATPSGRREDVRWGHGEGGAGVDPGDGQTVHRAAAGLRCERCGQGRYVQLCGIELAHVFELGQRYSAPMGLTYAGRDGEQATPLMACSGIGIGRCIQALADLGRDARGLRWPASVTPADVQVFATPGGDDRGPVQRVAAALAAGGARVLLDDREVSAGERFRYAWALGLPQFVVVSGRDPGRVEWVRRDTGERIDGEAGALIPQVLKCVATMS